jgi:hypothetical protein
MVAMVENQPEDFENFHSVLSRFFTMLVSVDWESASIEASTMQPKHRMRILRLNQQKWWRVIGI